MKERDELRKSKEELEHSYLILDQEYQSFAEEADRKYSKSSQCRVNEESQLAEEEEVPFEREAQGATSVPGDGGEGKRDPSQQAIDEVVLDQQYTGGADASVQDVPVSEIADPSITSSNVVSS
ncbi:hypothetical protein C5167_040872 [Papaver somniferum]|uniref:Uncharacterized protein n=1 Tax=Papaver somniferum TaxID=3469 RepID=A0A4Y7IGB8_PAPSO|nr:hypothetical protein C5167_040872 [Papaver somniferum]